MSDTQDPVPSTKPGWQTSEFWLKLAALLLTAAYASGVMTDNTVLAVAGIAATILGALGYTVSRTIAKRSVTASQVASPVSETATGTSVTP